MRTTRLIALLAESAARHASHPAWRGTWRLTALAAPSTQEQENLELAAANADLARQLEAATARATAAREAAQQAEAEAAEMRARVEEQQRLQAARMQQQEEEQARLLAQRAQAQEMQRAAQQQQQQEQQQEQEQEQQQQRAAVVVEEPLDERARRVLSRAAEARRASSAWQVGPLHACQRMRQPQGWVLFCRGPLQCLPQPCDVIVPGYLHAPSSHTPG